MDVRIPVEFMDGHVANSINFQLQEIQLRLTELSSFPLPLLICCASGMRSAQAAGFLQAQGVSCIKAGSRIDIPAH
ncbi:MAG: rhodanese-like domain-containing protein [Chitinophagia bacterium]|nr:rhodanese-like domain-containing protein [Chitinophagia bacterium]